MKRCISDILFKFNPLFTGHTALLPCSRKRIVLLVSMEIAVETNRLSDGGSKVQ